MAKVRLKIDKTGKVTQEVHGAPGGACREATRPYNDAFAGKTVSDERTPEADMPEIQSTENETEKQ